MNKTEQHFSTLAIRGKHHADPAYGSVSTPIYQTSTYEFSSVETGSKRFTGEESGYYYSRINNPTLTALEERLALLEGAESAVVTASGMGAISAMLLTFCRPNTHIIADCTLYGGTYSLLNDELKGFGVEIDFVDLSEESALENHLRKNTALVYLESPANPTLKITNLEKIAQTAHAYNKEIIVAVDNTLATPYLQQPLSFGCDIVVHSLTKYLNGHGDVVAGAVIGSAEHIDRVRNHGLKTLTGSVLGANEAFLIIRGLQTFTLRMERHCDNAEKVVDFLTKHPAVTKVYYPGLESHPNHTIAQQQMRRYGGMVSFEVNGGRAAGAKVLNALQFCLLAVSLGDAETLIEHPASMSHSPYSDEELLASGIPLGLIRLSVGLEDAQDIIDDLKQALDKMVQ